MTMTIKDRWKNFPEISDCTEYTVEVRKDLIWAFDLLQKAAIGSSNAMHSMWGQVKEAAQNELEINGGDLADENGNILEAVKDLTDFQDAWDELERAMHTVRHQTDKTVDEDRREKEIDDELNLLSTSMAKEFTGDVKTKKVKLNKKKKFPKKKFSKKKAKK
jgi:hypothetical protein